MYFETEIVKSVLIAFRFGIQKWKKSFMFAFFGWVLDILRGICYTVIKAYHCFVYGLEILVLRVCEQVCFFFVYSHYVILMPCKKTG